MNASELLPSKNILMVSIVGHVNLCQKKINIKKTTNFIPYVSGT